MLPASQSPRADAPIPLQGTRSASRSGISYELSPITYIMPRRAEFIFYQSKRVERCKQQTRQVSMPRRAEFIFNRSVGMASELAPIFPFQCPEGLNSFSILNLGYLEELNAMGFNAPKGWIHFLSNGVDCDPYLLYSFQCPEGLNSFSISGICAREWGSQWVSMPRRAEFIFYQYQDVCFDMKGLMFQCPEGLNSFSIFMPQYPLAVIGFSFNAPKGWIHFLSQWTRNSFG